MFFEDDDGNYIISKCSEHNHDESVFAANLAKEYPDVQVVNITTKQVVFTTDGLEADR